MALLSRPYEPIHDIIFVMSVAGNDARISSPPDIRTIADLIAAREWVENSISKEGLSLVSLPHFLSQKDVFGTFDYAQDVAFNVEKALHSLNLLPVRMRYLPVQERTPRHSTSVPDHPSGDAVEREKTKRDPVAFQSLSDQISQDSAQIDQTGHDRQDRHDSNPV